MKKNIISILLILIISIFSFNKMAFANISSDNSDVHNFNLGDDNQIYNVKVNDILLLIGKTSNSNMEGIIPNDNGITIKTIKPKDDLVILDHYANDNNIILDKNNPYFTVIYDSGHHEVGKAKISLLGFNNDIAKIKIEQIKPIDYQSNPGVTPIYNPAEYKINIEENYKQFSNIKETDRIKIPLSDRKSVEEYPPFTSILTGNEDTFTVEKIYKDPDKIILKSLMSDKIYEIDKNNPYVYKGIEYNDKLRISLIDISNLNEASLAIERFDKYDQSLYDGGNIKELEEYKTNSFLNQYKYWIITGILIIVILFMSIYFISRRKKKEGNL